MIFQSCTDLKKGGQLSNLDQLSKTIDSIEIVLNENRIDTLKKMHDSAKVISAQIGEFHSADTLSLVFAMKLDDYKLMVESIPEIKMYQIQLKEGIAELRTSVTNLRKDVTNSSGQKNRYSEFISFEKRKIDLLRDALNSFIDLRDKIINDFSSVEEEVRNFAFSGTE